MLHRLAWTAFRHRELLWTFVRRDLKGRFLGSYLGFGWNLVQPVILVLVYTFIFSTLMQLKLREGGDAKEYALFIFAAMVPWTAFAEAVGRTTNCILENANLIKKVAFPAEILPLYQVVYTLVTQAFGVVVLFAAACFLHPDYRPDARLLVLPLLFPLQLFFTLGVGYLLAALNVFVRDTQQFVNSFMILWMLATPIFYPEALVSKVVPALLDLNPQYYLVECYRWCFHVAGPRTDAAIGGYLGTYLGVGLAVLAVGYGFFMATKRKFADEI